RVSGRHHRHRDVGGRWREGPPSGEDAGGARGHQQCCGRGEVALRPSSLTPQPSPIETETRQSKAAVGDLIDAALRVDGFSKNVRLYAFARSGGPGES